MTLQNYCNDLTTNICIVRRSVYLIISVKNRSVKRVTYPTRFWANATYIGSYNRLFTDKIFMAQSLAHRIIESEACNYSVSCKLLYSAVYDYSI